MAQSNLVIETDSVAATQDVGAALAGLLEAGDVLALSGDLGAGKTAFTQGVARGLGITRPVTSPTFILVNEYHAPGGLTLQHVDCYRLTNAGAEMWDAGLSDLLAGEDLVVIEWAERIAELLPDAYLEVSFLYLDDTHRRLRFTPHGQRYARFLASLSRLLAAPAAR